MVSILPNSQPMPNVCILTDSTVQFTRSNFPGHERVYIIPSSLQNVIRPEGEFLSSCISAQKQLIPPSPQKFIQWYAIANYGEPDTLKAFCKENNLSYTHHCEATGEYDSTLAYWLPGMKKEFQTESNTNADAVVRVDEIKPYVDLLLEYAKYGKDAFPMFVGVPSLEETIETCMKKPAKALEIMEKEIKSLLPGAPSLPPLIING